MSTATSSPSSPPASPSGPRTGMDGRTARRLANRNRILDAALSLVAEGADMSVEAIAERSGVSVRSVYNHFPTARALIAGMYERGTELVRPHLEQLPPPHLPFAERVAAWVRVWARIQEDIADIRWRALIAEAAHPELQPELSDLRRAHLKEIARRFPEIKGKERQRAAVVLTDSLAWRALRRYQHLSFEAACEVIEEALLRLGED